ncbi:hypothetical protein [uncultured Eubacterium sp.]|uniref:hypothetical protein n=1 Tax=uncultured Eubacterium sp. TaxID=165185 RepID=UPI002673FBBE|nr:hypothetical protein [uncultured Eubacterium sp.]
METRIIKVEKELIVATQYDKGQVLEFDKIFSDGTEIHFINEKTKKKTILKDNRCDIPDEVLMQSGVSKIHVYSINEDSSRTVYTYSLKVVKRGEVPEGIAAENQQTYEEKLLQIMNDTKSEANRAEQIANSLKTAADNGEFKGETGLQGPAGEQGPPGINGYTPEKGTDYFTNDEIQEIVEQAANKVDLSKYALTNDTYTKEQTDTLINSIKQFNVVKVDELPSEGEALVLYLVQKEGEENDNYDEYVWIDRWEHIGTTTVELTNYVLNTRKIAGYTLKTDIDANALAGTIAQEFVRGGSWYSALIPWLINCCGSKAQQDKNTEGISELQNKDKWELILDKTLPATSSDGTLIDFDDLELKGEYKELRFVTVMWNTALEHVQLYVNEMEEPIVTLKSVLGSGATYSYDFTLSNNMVFPGRYLVMNLKRSQTGANASNCTENSFVNSSTDESVQNIQSITSLKLAMTAGWQNSTDRYIRVYGRK